MIVGFQFAGWLVAGGRAVMEAALGEWAAEPFVEEEEQGDLSRNTSPSQISGAGGSSTSGLSKKVSARLAVDSEGGTPMLART